MEPLLISRKRVLEKMDMRRLILEVSVALSDLSEGKVIAPPRQVTSYSGNNTHLNMSVYYSRMDKWITKLVTVIPGNKELGRPLIQASIIVQDGVSGETQALLEGSSITALRTAAGSGVATKLMLSHRSIDTIAIFGTGAQAETHLQAMVAVKRFKQAIIFGSTPDKAKQFCESQKRHYPEIALTVGQDISQLKSAEIICTCTTAVSPLFSLADIHPDVHINAVGAFQPYTRELPTEVISKATILVDNLAGCKEEAGDLLIPVNETRLDWQRVKELGQALKSNQTNRRGISVYKSVGHGILDAAAVATLLKEA